MNKVSFGELRNSTNQWKEAVIVFKSGCFKRGETVEGRSYLISSDAKFFHGDMLGKSLYGYCLDGTDPSARLDFLMSKIDNPENTWEIDYCYIRKENGE